MRGINRVTLVGNLGKDPELKTLPDGTLVVKMTVATTETYRAKDGGSHTHTDWHTVVAWRGLASIAGQYLHKGSLVYIEGKIRYRQFEDKEGLKKHVTEIVADQLLMLDKRASGTQSSGNNEDIANEPPPF
jgi:single-strand DNA-binding protein